MRRVRNGRGPGWLIVGATLLGACASGEAQSEDCAAYVQCLAARDQVLGSTTNVARFQADGACWGSIPGAEACDHACRRGLDWLRSHESGLPEVCKP